MATSNKSYINYKLIIKINYYLRQLLIKLYNSKQCNGLQRLEDKCPTPIRTSHKWLCTQRRSLTIFDVKQSAENTAMLEGGRPAQRVVMTTSVSSKWSLPSAPVMSLGSDSETKRTTLPHLTHYLPNPSSSHQLYIIVHNCKYNSYLKPFNRYPKCYYQKEYNCLLCPK